METKRTNRSILVKGVKTLGICLLLMFIGPTLLHIAFSNQDKATYPLVLGIALIACGGAMFLLFRGISIIMKSLFND